MKKRIPLGTALALIFMAVALSVSLTEIFAMERFSATVNNVAARQAMFDYLTEVDKSVRQNYAGTIDEQKLQEQLASAYMQAIGDKYADYYTAEEYAVYQQQAAGTVNGFGITLTQNATDGRIVIATVDEGSPAALAGVMIGDVLQAIDSVYLSSNVKDLMDATANLEDYSKMMITVQRNKKSYSFDLTRSTYPIISVTGRLIDNTVGYVRVLTFNETTVDQFSTLLDSLSNQGAKSFVFDLRGNTGGTTDAAVEIVDYLMPRGVFATSIASDGTKTPLTGASAYELSVPSVTLVSATTAGEAELFAGVLQEFSLTRVVGEKTAGKALVQTLFPISSNNAAVKLSTAELSLLSGGSWEGKGITPDQTVFLAADAPSLDLLDDAKDTQLQAALTHLHQIGEPAKPPATTTTGTGTTTGTVGTTTTKN